MMYRVGFFFSGITQDKAMSFLPFTVRKKTAPDFKALEDRLHCFMKPGVPMHRELGFMKLTAPECLAS